MNDAAEDLLPDLSRPSRFGFFSSRHRKTKKMVKELVASGRCYHHAFVKDSLGLSFAIARYGSGREYVVVEETMPECEIYPEPLNDELIAINDKLLTGRLSPKRLEAIQSRISKAKRPLKLTFFKGHGRDQAYQMQMEWRAMSEYNKSSRTTPSALGSQVQALAGESSQYLEAVMLAIKAHDINDARRSANQSREAAQMAAQLNDLAKRRLIDAKSLSGCQEQEQDAEETVLRTGEGSERAFELANAALEMVDAAVLASARIRSSSLAFKDYSVTCPPIMEGDENESCAASPASALHPSSFLQDVFFEQQQQDEQVDTSANMNQVAHDDPCNDTLLPKEEADDDSAFRLPMEGMIAEDDDKSAKERKEDDASSVGNNLGAEDDECSGETSDPDESGKEDCEEWDEFPGSAVAARAEEENGVLSEEDDPSTADEDSDSRGYSVEETMPRRQRINVARIVPLRSHETSDGEETKMNLSEKLYEAAADTASYVGALFGKSQNGERCNPPEKSPSTSVPDDRSTHRGNSHPSLGIIFKECSSTDKAMSVELDPSEAKMQRTRTRIASADATITEHLNEEEPRKSSVLWSTNGTESAVQMDTDNGMKIRGMAKSYAQEARRALEDTRENVASRQHLRPLSMSGADWDVNALNNAAAAVKRGKAAALEVASLLRESRHILDRMVERSYLEDDISRAKSTHNVVSEFAQNARLDADEAETIFNETTVFRSKTSPRSEAAPSSFDLSIIERISQPASEDDDGDSLSASHAVSDEDSVRIPFGGVGIAGSVETSEDHASRRVDLDSKAGKRDARGLEVSDATEPRSRRTMSSSRDAEDMMGACGCQPSSWMCGAYSGEDEAVRDEPSHTIDSFDEKMFESGKFWEPLNTRTASEADSDISF